MTNSAASASVAGPARQLGTTWRTVWRSIKRLLEALAADPIRFKNVTTEASTNTSGTTRLPLIASVGPLDVPGRSK